VRSRRGWLMTELLPEFASLPVHGVFDGAARVAAESTSR
jgi:hypothetical protein